MPEKYQVVQTLRRHLNSAMYWVKTQVNQQGVAGDACYQCWTRAIEAALCHASVDAWGKCNPQICATIPNFANPAQGTVCRNQAAHICRNQFGPYADLGANQGERLLDVTCLQGPWPVHQKTLLVAESEWGNRGEVLRDFAKLLMLRAEVRVMVYHQQRIGFNQLSDYIHQCQDAQAGDTYLLAAFGDAPNTPRIVYYRIDAHQAQAELDQIPSDWYPEHGPPQP